MRNVLVAISIAILLVGCAARAPADPPGGLPVGSSEQQLTVDGASRDFRVFIPETLPDRAPLVVMLHGGFGSSKQAEDSYGWDAAATANGFVVVYPNGLDRAWNVGGGCCGKSGTNNVDDVAFITAVVATLEASVSIDPNRVFATGISNGGMMAYRLACDASVFAAIGPDSTTLLGECPAPDPVSVIHIHGLADSNVPFDGSQGDGKVKIDGAPVPEVIAIFADADDCEPATVTNAGEVTTSVASCLGGRSVELITIASAGHQWPGSVRKPALENLLGTDTPSTALDATDTIWAFFAAHPKS
jgi:polyhydroxybutyrate depolymerase